MTAARDTAAQDFVGESFLEHVWTAGHDRELSEREIIGLTISGQELVRNAFDAIRGVRVPAGKTVRLTVKIESVDPDPEYHAATESGETDR